MIAVGRPNSPGRGVKYNPRWVVLGCMRKQAEQAMGSDPVGSVPPWSLLQFLPWLPAFLLKLLLAIVFITATETKVGQEDSRLGIRRKKHSCGTEWGGTDYVSYSLLSKTFYVVYNP